jgi:hypothetical protein
MLTLGVLVAPGVGFEPTRPKGSQAHHSCRNSRRELPRLESAPYQIPRKALGHPGTNIR